MASDQPDTAATTEGEPMEGTPATYPPADADRIFCPDCERAVFYQRVHVSTHEPECPPEGKP